MTHFSVGLIPFKRNTLTLSVDAIKYYEYRALGLPVISTSFGEMTRRRKEPGVFIVGRVCDLKTLVETALRFTAEEKEILEFRASNDWGARFDAGQIFP